MSEKDCLIFEKVEKHLQIEIYLYFISFFGRTWQLFKFSQKRGIPKLWQYKGYDN